MIPNLFRSTPSTGRVRPVLAAWLALPMPLALAWILSSPVLGSPVISEFMAANGSSLLDDDGEPSDWIEIHNPDLAPLSLEGWSLSDDPDLPGKWRFPSVLLPADGRLVVFASGKNRQGPGPLHTNFRLDASGEYLALFPPDGTAPSTEFSPAFPPQDQDISFGFPGSGASIDLLAEAPVSVLVPTSAADLDPSWTLPGFQPVPPWRSVAGLGLGFDEVPSSPGASVNLALTGTAQQSTTGFAFGPANAIDGNPDSFTHTNSDDDASTWWVDLGEPYEIQRIVLRNRTSCCASRLRDITVSLLAPDGAVVWTSALLNPENQLVNPASMTLDLFDLNVGPVYAQTVRVARTPDPDLSGSGGEGNNDEDNVLSLGEVEVYGVESLSLNPWIQSDLSEAMRGRSASAFVRIPFVLDDPASVRSLSLSLRYDDGVTGFLNGQPIIAANAPAAPAWNSTSLAERPKAEAIVPVTVDLGSYRSSWRPGTNWLAFQGLNAGVSDAEFLLHAELHLDSDAAVPAAYLDRPTPGAANVSGWTAGRVADTRFSVQRGLYSEPFDLSITTATPGAQIRYTLDGSAPSASHGEVYTAPVRITRSTVVRAAAFKSTYRPTNVDTHTYLFLANVAAQPTEPPGFPARWAGVPSDYAIDARIAAHPSYAPRFVDSLKSLPSLSLVLALDDLFGSSKGIYANPESSGPSWERPVSLEWIDPQGEDTFQTDAGLRIQGGYFRQRNVTQKHSLRLLFKDEYGPGRLRRDLFHEFGAAREFDTLVLRAGANDGYSWDAARDTEQFLRDEFGRRLHLAMGHPSPRGTFVHLYLNGLYWGLYNLTERPAEDFSATYLGGEPEDWDAINSGEVKNGDFGAWSAFLSSARSASTLADYQRLKGANADGTPNPEYPTYLDPANYIDYMLVNMWGGNWDWPFKNFWFGRDRTGRAGGFRFYIWDFENTMGNNRDRSPLNMVSPQPGAASSWVAEPHSLLRRIPEYRMEFADRVHRHFFQGGVLSPESLVPRYRALADQVEPAIMNESARWGDDHHSPPQDPSDWLRERDWILGTYLPQRTAIVLQQLRASGLYPQTAAPVAEPPGGPIVPGTTIHLAASASELFYTTNGVDPRLPGGAIHPQAIHVTFSESSPPPNPNLVLTGHSWRYLADGTDPGPDWNQPGFQDSAWSFGPSPLGYGDGDEATEVGFIDVDVSQAGIQRNATTYFRTEFVVESPASFESFTVNLVYDDAAAVFLNGTEIIRTDNLPSDARADSYATSSSPENAVLSRSSLSATLLRAGTNVLAVEIHQSGASSSDISFDLDLVATSTSSVAQPFRTPVVLAGSTLIRARTRHNGEWSALTETRFSSAAVPASTNHLVISQFCYRPAEPVASQEREVSTNRDDFEYLELLNVGSEPIDLTGVRLTTGVLYDFPPGRSLAPGARRILVSHRAAFEARFGAGLPVEGEYDGRLDNAGEVIVLSDAAGRDLRRFAYGDRPPWPALPNQAGFALVLQRPHSLPDHRDPLNWRSSVLIHGTPGASDASTFAGTPTGDSDLNGQWDLLDYAFGVPRGATPAPLVADVESVEVNGVRLHFPRIALTRNPGADDASLILEVAEHLAGPWRNGASSFELVEEERLSPSVARVLFRLNQPLESHPTVFIRLGVAWVP